MGKRIMYVFIVGFIMVLMIPAWEATFGSITRDDCRVVNLEKVLEFKDGNITFYRTSEGRVHTVTYDSNGKHYDLSKSFKVDAPLEIQNKLSKISYLQYEKTFIKGNTLLIGRFKNGQVEEYNLKENMTSWMYRYYIWLFTQTKHCIESI